MVAIRIRNVCSEPYLYVLALAFLSCGQLVAEVPFAEAKSKLEQALEGNSIKISLRQRIARIDTSYLEKLATLKDQFFDLGSLDGVLEVQDEIKRIENSDRTRTAFSEIKELAVYQRIYADEIKKIESDELTGVLVAYKAYGEALEEREEELVRIGFIEKAVEVRKERVRVGNLIRDLSRGEVKLASLRPEEVFIRPGEEEAGVPIDVKRDAVEDDVKRVTEALDALEALLKKSLAEHLEMVASKESKLFDEYSERLRGAEFNYQSLGSLDGVQGVRAEMKSLKETGALLAGTTQLKHLDAVKKQFSRDIEELRSTVREQWISIYQGHQDRLGEIERWMVQKRLVDQAIGLRKERERVAELIARQARRGLVLSLPQPNREK